MSNIPSRPRKRYRPLDFFFFPPACKQLNVPSQKLYKTKFKEWNWQKNLSADAALFMAEKAKRRKREEGKDTEFSFGGRTWDRDRVENTLSRATKTRPSEHAASKFHQIRPAVRRLAVVSFAELESLTNSDRRRNT